MTIVSSAVWDTQCMKEYKYGIALSSHRGIVIAASMMKNIMKKRNVCFLFINKKKYPQA
jgi:hypothetical protein